MNWFSFGRFTEFQKRQSALAKQELQCGSRARCRIYEMNARRMLQVTLERLNLSFITIKNLICAKLALIYGGI
jgi:hypothetical protein